jgi:large subunit ribosomal protein L4
VADLKAPLFTSEGDVKGDIALDAGVFGIEPNLPVMHQVVTAQLAGARAGTHSTKRRGEVRGGGRKPWRQKGLGRARQGSIRAPHWKGGGVAHGPKPRDYTQRTPKKMKRLALRSALSARASESAIIVTEPIEWAEAKTSHAVAFLAKVGVAGKILLIINHTDVVAARAFRNLPNVMISEPGQVTTYDVLWSDRVIFTTHTVGSIGRTGSYEVADDDFVKEANA